MLNIFTNQKVRSRMQSGPMGPYLSEIAAVLWQQGYARSTIRLHLQLIGRSQDQFVLTIHLLNSSQRVR